MLKAVIHLGQAKLAAKEEERGMVITLSGSVLFRSNDATLLPTAQTRPGSSNIFWRPARTARRTFPVAKSSR
jgi:flagellar motor protein MotB